MRLIIARCSVDYVGRLTAHLPMATRLLMIKADGTVLIHADSGTKALNWMAPGSRLSVEPLQESGSYGGPSRVPNSVINRPRLYPLLPGHVCLSSPSPPKSDAAR